MSLILSCIGFLAACLFTYISGKLEDDIESQVTKVAAFVAFILSFVFSPLLFKLFMVGFLAFIWSVLGDRLTMSFYRKFNK